MLARMYLTWASHLQYFENNPEEAATYYQKAKAAADTVINNPTAYNVELYSNIGDVFNPHNNKENKEAMFIVGHARGEGLNAQTAVNRLCTYFTSTYDLGIGVKQSAANGYGKAEFVPTRYLLELYDETKDARYAAFFREVWRCNDPDARTMNWPSPMITLFQKDPTKFFNNVIDKTKLGFNIGDTVLYYTKRKITNKATVRYAVRDIDDVFNEDGTYVEENTDNFFPQLMKHHDSLYIAGVGTSSVSGRLDVIMMRFAEMYLISAEAAFHLDNEAEGLAKVNVLRERAKVAGLPAGANDATSADVNKTPCASGIPHLDFILDERARELCGEHLRWFDLKRTKQLENRLGAGKANPNVKSFDKTKHYARPIPMKFLQSINNAAEFGQNPGY
jgi:hypothetical protein